MHRFFADENGVTDGSARLETEDAQHALRVLRLKAGDEIHLFASGRAYAAQITDIAGGVTVRVQGELPSPEPTLRVTLYQGVPKGDRMDYIVQKCTEAGVHAIVPVNMPRSVARLDAHDDKKLARWNRIAREAAKQAFRSHVPQVLQPIGMQQLCERMQAHQLTLVPWEDARDGAIRNVVTAKTLDLALVIGPEGGMGENEVEQLMAAGAKTVTLGPRIFRTETAGLAALIAAMTVTGNLE